MVALIFPVKSISWNPREDRHTEPFILWDCQLSIFPRSVLISGLLMWFDPKKDNQQTPLSPHHEKWLSSEDTSYEWWHLSCDMGLLLTSFWHPYPYFRPLHLLSQKPESNFQKIQQPIANNNETESSMCNRNHDGREKRPWWVFNSSERRNFYLDHLLHYIIIHQI